MLIVSHNHQDENDCFGGKLLNKRTQHLDNCVNKNFLNYLSPFMPPRSVQRALLVVNKDCFNHRSYIHKSSHHLRRNGNAV